MSTNWPFVSRARYEELKQQYVELKEAHERIVDAAYAIQTGFHLYARFEQKAVAEPVALKQTKSAPDEDQPPGTVRAALQNIETHNISTFEQKRKTMQDIADASRAAAARKMEETLREADTAAASQGAD